MSIDYKYSTLAKPLSYTEHSPAMQVAEQPSYDKAEMSTDSVYTLAPCIP